MDGDWQRELAEQQMHAQAEQDAWEHYERVRGYYD